MRIPMMTQACDCASTYSPLRADIWLWLDLREGDLLMTTSAAILVLATFLASAVEAVEALTVVLAVGVTRGWRSPLIAAGAATLALAAVIVIFGPALTLIPIDVLRLI